MIDLHTHSLYSDGTDTVEQIIEKAKALGLSQISITDHNILTGSIAASKIAEGIDYIIGTELTVDYNGSEVHLLSYFPNGSKTDYKNVQFIIKEAEAYKRIALLETIERLNDMGIDININELKEFSKGIMNRVHICKVLMKHGYVNSVSEGFDKYVGDHCPAYVPRKTISINTAIEAVHNDGGIAIVAHPYEYVENFDIDEFFTEVIDKIDGIECYHPSANEENIKHLLDIANKHNKLITGGSDYHGTNKTHNDLNVMQVDDKYQIKRNNK